MYIPVIFNYFNHFNHYLPIIKYLNQRLHLIHFHLRVLPNQTQFPLH